jgi:protein-disulfide isomerase
VTILARDNCALRAESVPRSRETTIARLEQAPYHRSVGYRVLSRRQRRATRLLFKSRCSDVWPNGVDDLFARHRYNSPRETTMKSQLDRALSVALTLAAAALAIAVVHREFFAKSPEPGRVTAQKPEFMPAWRDAISVGVLVGRSDARVKIVELADLECPFCRRFHQAAHQVMAEHPSDVAIVFVHYPLRMHRFASQAARAAECAGERGRFAELISAVFSNQDSLGIKTWASYGKEAGIDDAQAFQRCALDGTTPKRVADGKAFGDSINVVGTPTVIVNGWRFTGTPTYAMLDSTVRAQLATNAR